MSKKVADNKLWNNSLLIAEEAYGHLAELPEEEQYGMRQRLRNRSFEISSDIAEASGAISPRDKKYYYGLARKGLFVLKNIYTLAMRTDMLKVEPETMLIIDELTDRINEEIDKTTSAIPAYIYQLDEQRKREKDEA